MSDETMIRVESVSKSFKLPHEKNTSIKSAVLSFHKRKKSHETQRVLDNITFEVKKGEFFGIVGRNGGGKSTLLKLLAGIYTPTSGTVTVNGKLTPFIELGVGFNHELTGRENVFLNGALLGFSRKEVAVMYKDIVKFAELERFMDQKLKNYSSGMQVRLAFSIAIQAKSDILVLDEVLAVGDEAFQKKCIDVFENYKSENQTVILVTHDMATVKRFCTRAILISDGEIVSEGDPTKVSQDYTELNNKAIGKSVAEKNALLNNKYTTKTKIVGKKLVDHKDTVSLSIDWSGIKKPVKNIGVAVFSNSGEYVFGTNTIVDDIKLSGKKASYEFEALLGPGNYHFKVGIFGETDEEVVEFLHRGPEFTIKSSPEIRWQGITKLNHTWKQ